MASRRERIQSAMMGGFGQGFSSAEQLFGRSSPGLSALIKTRSYDMHGGIPSHQTSRYQTEIDRALMAAKVAANQVQSANVTSAETLKARGLPEWAGKIKGFNAETGTIQDLENLLVNNPSLVTNKNEQALDFLRSKGYTPEFGASKRTDMNYTVGEKGVQKFHKKDTKEYSREEAVGKLMDGFQEGAGRGEMIRGSENGQRGSYMRNIAGGVSFVPDNSQAEINVFGADPTKEKMIREQALGFGRLDFAMGQNRDSMEFARMLRGEDPNEGGFGIGFREAALDTQRVLKDTGLGDIPILGSAVNSFAMAAAEAGNAMAGRNVDYSKLGQGIAGAAGAFGPAGKLFGETVNAGIGLAEAAESGDIMSGIEKLGKASLSFLDQAGLTGELKEALGGVLESVGGEAAKKVIDQLKEAAKGGLDSLKDAAGNLIKEQAQGIAEKAGEQVGQFVTQQGSQIGQGLLQRATEQFGDISTAARNALGQFGVPESVIQDIGSRAQAFGQRSLEQAGQRAGEAILAGQNPLAAGFSSLQESARGIGQEALNQGRSFVENEAKKFGKEALDNLTTSLNPQEMFNMIRQIA